MLPVSCFPFHPLIPFQAARSSHSQIYFNATAFPLSYLLGDQVLSLSLALLSRIIIYNLSSIILLSS